MQWSAGTAPQWVNCSLAEPAIAPGDTPLFVCVCVCEHEWVCVSPEMMGSAYRVSLFLPDSALIIAPSQGSPWRTHAHFCTVTHTPTLSSCSIERCARAELVTNKKIHNTLMSHCSGLTSEALLSSSASNECLAHKHTHTYTVLTVKAPVETIEDSLQRPAGLSDQSLCFFGAQTGQVLLHCAGTASRALRTHPQMFTWRSERDTN